MPAEAVDYGRDPRFVAIRADIESWWDGSDENVLPGDPPPETDIFDDLPEIDSKIVALTSPIFEKHLGIKLILRLIRKGGYESKEHLITHLVPQMLAFVDKKDGDEEE